MIIATWRRNAFRSRTRRCNAIGPHSVSRNITPQRPTTHLRGLVSLASTLDPPYDSTYPYRSAAEVFAVAALFAIDDPDELHALEVALSDAKFKPFPDSRPYLGDPVVAR